SMAVLGADMQRPADQTVDGAVCRTGGSVRAGAGPSVAALQRATLVFGQAAPYAGVLATLKRPAQALVTYITASAYGLRIFDLQQRRSGVANRKEQLRVFVATGSTVAPVHRSLSSSSTREAAFPTGYFVIGVAHGWFLVIAGSDRS